MFDQDKLKIEGNKIILVLHNTTPVVFFEPYLALKWRFFSPKTSWKACHMITQLTRMIYTNFHKVVKIFTQKMEMYPYFHF